MESRKMVLMKLFWRAAMEMQPWRTDLWVRAGEEGEGETDGEGSVQTCTLRYGI